MSQQDIVVLGAGIVGKAAALALARQGLRVIHIAPDLGVNSLHAQTIPNENTWDSRIYAISSSSQKLLNELQVWDAISPERIQPVRDMRVFGDSGEHEDAIHFSAFQGTVPQLSWIVESQQIEAALDLASRFQTNLERIADEVTAFQNTPTGISVETASGKHYSAKLMIAADGANSKVRQQLGIETSVDHYEQTAVVANFKCTQAHLETAFQWFLSKGDILALLPLPGRKLSMVWSTTPEHAEKLLKLAEQDPKGFCESVQSSANGEVFNHLGELDLMAAPHSFPLRRIWAKELIGPSEDPHIVLVGDAAHAMHPLAGQGLNLGLRDIAILQQILKERESFRSVNDRVLLRRYERARQGDIQALLMTTHHLQKLFHHPKDSTKKLRNLGMKLLNRSAFIKRQLIQKALG